MQWREERVEGRVPGEDCRDPNAFFSVNQLLEGDNYSVCLRPSPLRVPFLLCIDAGIQKSMNSSQRRLLRTGECGAFLVLGGPTRM